MPRVRLRRQGGLRMEKKKRRKKKKKVPVVQHNRESSPEKHKPSSRTPTKPASNSSVGHKPASSQKQPTPGPSRLARSSSPVTELQCVPETVQAESSNSATLDPVAALAPSAKGKERATSVDITPASPSKIDESLVEELNSHRSLTRELFPSLVCNICLYLMHRPFVLSPCGHVACLSCLVSWFTSEPLDQPQNQPDQVVLHAPLLPSEVALPALGGAADEVAIVPAPPPAPARPPRALPKHKKTCPQCRARIRTRPVEVWPVKDMVGNVVRSGLADPDSVPPALREGAPAGTGIEEDPWSVIFPTMSVDKDRLRRLITHESFGNQDLMDEGIYRCVDCFHEIMDGVCSECGRVYHGHFGGTDVDVDVDDFSDEGGMDDDFGFALGFHPNLRYLDGSEDDFYGAPMNVHWTDDEQEPSDADDESEESYESSFIDDDEDMGGSDDGTEVGGPEIELVDHAGGLDEEESDADIPAPPPRRRSRSGRRGDPYVISSDDEDEDEDEEEPESPPLRQYGRGSWRTRGVIEPGEEEQDDSDHSEGGQLSEVYNSDDGSEDLAAEVAARESELYGDDGSVPSRRTSSRYGLRSRGIDIVDWTSDGYDTESLGSGSASEDGGVDFMDGE
ncbi:hypothetical protein BDY19DRAFT_187981 [Irpex rosettiformis]|uniref:Uncharacterized protein n=1 Tax=Irpex rosettiformis TaxID=378272 RepID=A0ACB8U1K4_9APHY|nr:hypothetical protein BDY19DRAFT_187981 [Irpex rosettiformis]